MKALNIKRIQPKLISDNHDKFVHNYNESGKSKFLNRLCVQMIKKQDECIYPCE